MARPKKQGVDYFPLDVHLDNKFKFIEIKFGLEGFATVIKMMQEIYANRYYCDWGEDEQLLFSDEHRIDFDKLQLITDECVKRNIFNKQLYDKYKILTSEGIQKRYKEIVRRRVDVELVEEYLLIDGDFGISSGVNDDINPSASSQSDSKSTQSKVKESKGKEKNTSRSKLKFETHHLQLAELLFNEMKKNNENVKEPNFEQWANTFRLMMERDKRKGKEIQDLIIFSQKHSFWYKNIMSANKLRDQFDRLQIEMNEKKPKNNNENRKVVDFDVGQRNIHFQNE